MAADTLRDGVDPVSLGFDDLGGIVLGLALWLAIIIAAPVLVLVIAVLLFSVELPVVIVIGLLLVVARFAGLVPWTVVIIDPVHGVERRETFRNLFHALSRIRGVNHDRRVAVRWAWA
jgi:hypothetical protein